MARCAGSSGGFASYRRDPLVEAHREGREGGACYNFLYCIEDGECSSSSGADADRNRRYEYVDTRSVADIADRALLPDNDPMFSSPVSCAPSGVLARQMPGPPAAISASDGHGVLVKLVVWFGLKLDRSLGGEVVGRMVGPVLESHHRDDTSAGVGELVRHLVRGKPDAARPEESQTAALAGGVAEWTPGQRSATPNESQRGQLRARVRPASRPEPRARLRCGRWRGCLDLLVRKAWDASKASANRSCSRFGSRISATRPTAARRTRALLSAGGTHPTSQERQPRLSWSSTIVPNLAATFPGSRPIRRQRIDAMRSPSERSSARNASFALALPSAEASSISSWS